MDTNQAQLTSLLPTLQAMRAAHQQAGAVSADTRIDRLQRLANLLVKHADDFCGTLDADFGGRHPTFSLMNDVLSTLSSVKYARGNIRRWMKPDRRAGVFPFNLFGARVDVEHQPKGVVGILGTWNVPLFTTFVPLAFALAGGNRAMLKPSEFVPRTAELMARAIADHFAADEICVVNGAAEISRAFSSLPFDHMVLTGSCATGRAVMRAAAEHLVPVTLELGGKSPVIIGRSADLDLAALRIVMGKTMNAGQICVAPDTVHVPVELVEAFVSAVRAHYLALYPQTAGNRDVTAVVNDTHMARVEGYLKEVAAAGGRIEACADEATTTGRYRPLRLAIAPPANAGIRSEEIFGPVLQVEPYQDLGTVIDGINRGGKPLALYYFGKDRAEERRILDHTQSGGVTVNDVVIHVAAHDAPFGGVGASGMGQYHGREGFQEFSHARTIYRSGWWDPRQAFGLLPPYSDKLEQTLRKMLKP
ncbi:MAG: aldehyde dehydrogenase family protein [Betaproteobacteria bacterium]